MLCRCYCNSETSKKTSDNEYVSRRGKRNFKSQKIKIEFGIACY